MRKGYSETSGGQIHWRLWRPAHSNPAPDLYCLHPSPFSGMAFENIAPLLATNRRVIAPDYPGFGGSDPLPAAPSIADYASSMAEVVRDLSGADSVDMLGFHTGCLVAAELAVVEPQLCNRLCLIDVPAFDAKTSAEMVEKFSKPFAIGDDLSTLEGPWNSTFASRKQPQGAEAAFAMLVEQLRAGTGMNAAFHAAFSYPWAERFAEVSGRALVIATKSGLLESTREAAKAIPSAEYIEDLAIAGSVLNAAASETAAAVKTYLERTT